MNDLRLFVNPSVSGIKQTSAGSHFGKTAAITELAPFFFCCVLVLKPVLIYDPSFHSCPSYLTSRSL